MRSSDGLRRRFYDAVRCKPPHAVISPYMDVFRRFPKVVSFYAITRRMRAVTNILILVAGVAGSGLVAAFTVTIMAEAGPLRSCLEESCGYAALFMAFPLAWFILFSLFVMAMLIWRRKPRRDCWK
ncbi:hypothetical protein DSM25559_3016 [Agrobacterium rosae]|uniref:Uncharacterized protein n=2 Tax=Agrobacterium rosae TaxID=1972867 RepID=A0A1R3TV49_9HYPH|nr:hypothetical protein DSM25559_3016 [Agrobacterium rosae]